MDKKRLKRQKNIPEKSQVQIRKEGMDSVEMHHRGRERIENKEEKNERGELH